MASPTVSNDDDDVPCHFLPGRADSGIVLLCDHASNRLPAAYETLGLAASELERHIAYDIGAAEVTRRLASALQAPAVLSNFCRLLIDPNRGEDDPTLIMQLSDGAIIPGNRNLSAEERRCRVALYYEPYHSAVTAAINVAIAAGRPPLLLSIHSFTHEWRGCLRPWEAGILWDEDARLARMLLDCLRHETDFTIGDNEPYCGRLSGDSMHRHGTMRGLAHALVEIRQDQIKHEEGQGEWAGRLADIMTRILADDERARELATIHVSL